MSELMSGRAGGPEVEPGEGRKTLLYGVVVGAIVAIDALTKRIAQDTLPLYEPVPVLGDFFRLTYIYNRGAAFGLHLGDYSRLIFLVLTVVVVGVLLSWFRTTPASDRLRLAAIAIVTAGAIGNFIDRARSPRGVVDFLDLGLGNLRWPVFNVADIAVMTGALLLAISLWREEREAERGHG
jgi:signal peptidase II